MEPRPITNDDLLSGFLSLQTLYGNHYQLSMTAESGDKNRSLTIVLLKICSQKQNLCTVKPLHILHIITFIIIIIIIVLLLLLPLSLERFSNDCRKTKTKVITPTNHNRSKQRNEPIRIPSATCSRRGENRAYKMRLVLVLLLIG